MIMLQCDVLYELIAWRYQGFMPTMYGYASQGSLSATCELACSSLTGRCPALTLVSGLPGALKYGMYEFIKDSMNAKDPNYVPGKFLPPNMCMARDARC